MREGLSFPLCSNYSLCRKSMVADLIFHKTCFPFLSFFLPGLYGILFEKHKEAAFANYRLWESLGFVIAFGYSTKLQAYIKLYILLSVLVLSMVTYGAVEYLEAKRSPGTPTATKENGIPCSQETHM